MNALRESLVLRVPIQTGLAWWFVLAVPLSSAACGADGSISQAGGKPDAATHDDGGGPDVTGGGPDVAVRDGASTDATLGPDAGGCPYPATPFESIQGSTCQQKGLVCPADAPASACDTAPECTCDGEVFMCSTGL